MDAKEVRKEIELIVGGTFDTACTIFDCFLDANDKNYHQLKYCLKNCRLNCLYGKKRRKEGN